MKNQKGVSLITLVITIIVVIILAAIALGGGATDSIAEANYAGFTTELGGLQESMTTAIATTKGQLGAKGITKTDAQIINYLARGTWDFTDESGEAAWLTAADAANVVCTPIQAATAKEAIGMDLPSRKVETAKTSGQKMSYFVTAKGVVFCWPPYEYNDEAYYTNKEYLKGTSAIDATSGEVTLTFNAGTKDAEIVKISQTDGATPTTLATKNFGSKSGEVNVVYGSTEVDTTLGGVAQGYLFTGYKNNQ